MTSASAVTSSGESGEISARGGVRRTIRRSTPSALSDEPKRGPAGLASIVALRLRLSVRPGGFARTSAGCAIITSGADKRRTASLPTIDLDDEELAAVIAVLKEKLDRDRYPLSPRLEPFRAALAKLDPRSVPKPAALRPPLPQASRTRGSRPRR